jgi:hypothetical protein
MTSPWVCPSRPAGFLARPAHRRVAGGEPAGLGRPWAVNGRPRGTDDDRHPPRQPVPSAVSAAVRTPARLPTHFLRNKKQEWEEYRSEVTPFELRKMLPVL